MTSGAHIDNFRRIGIRYLSANEYRPPSLAAPDVRKTFYYRRNRHEFEALTARYSAPLAAFTTLESQTWLEIRFLGGLLGNGLFATNSIAVGELIGEYLGIVRPARKGRPLSAGNYTTDYSWGFPKVRNLGRQLEIDARVAGGPLRFANHSDQPNAYPEHFTVDGRWRVVFIATHPIVAGEEITVDYGEAYWSGGERELVL